VCSVFLKLEQSNPHQIPFWNPIEKGSFQHWLEGVREVEFLGSEEGEIGYLASCRSG